MPDEDKKFGGPLILDFQKVMTSRENDLLSHFGVFLLLLIIIFEYKSFGLFQERRKTG